LAYQYTSCYSEADGDTSAPAGNQIIKNSIIWDNGTNLLNCSATYSCFPGGINTNIGQDPEFVDIEGSDGIPGTGDEDYHLWYTSPCIAAGDDGSDMGTYGNTSEATDITDNNGDGMADEWQSTYWDGTGGTSVFDPGIAPPTVPPADPMTSWAPDVDSDGDGLINLVEYQIGWDPTHNDSSGGTGPISTLVENDRTGISYPSISFAVNFAENEDTLTAQPGTYAEQVSFGGKILHLRSTDPGSSAIVEGTIINPGDTSVDCVIFDFGETSDSIIEGFTITGGYRGIRCKNSASPQIRKCTVRDNTWHGISIYDTAGWPVITECAIIGNDEDGVYSNSNLTLENSLIVKNSNDGVQQDSSDATSTVINCTVYGNTVKGLKGSFDDIRNCIIWGNGDDLEGCSATYSCVLDPDEGEGNIHLYPAFIDVDNDDYHLWHSSACVDAGDGSPYSNEPGDGGGCINMGAYGNTPEARTITDINEGTGDGIADEWQAFYWDGTGGTSVFNPGIAPPTVPPADPMASWAPDVDSDGDGLLNIDEYYIGWNPVSDDSASIFGIVHNNQRDLYYPNITLAILLAYDDYAVRTHLPWLHEITAYMEYVDGELGL
jgi:parallel beta-helix repeat protein